MQIFFHIRFRNTTLLSKLSNKLGRWHDFNLDLLMVSEQMILQYHSDLIQVFRQQIVRLVRCCFCSQGFHDLAKKISQNPADLGPSSAWDYSGCHKRKFEEEGGGVCGKVVRWENFWKKTWAICFAWNMKLSHHLII